MRSTAIFFCGVAALGLVPGPALARETPRLLPVQKAMESEKGREQLLDLPVFFKGQEHPPVAKRIQHASYEHMERGAFRSDEKACTVAVVAVLRDLQERARKENADAIVDVVSVSSGETTHESSTEYRCVAGHLVVRVGLRGTFVKLE